MKVLHEIAAARATGKTVEQYNNAVRHALDKYLPLRHNNADDVRKDIISHFILRLAFCQQQHRSWFLHQEVALLEYRLKQSGADIAEFLAENGMDYKALTEEEFGPLQEQLEVVYHDCLPLPHNAAMYYPVPFLEALPLLKGRRVLLHNGNAIVHSQKLIQIIGMHFRSELSRALSITAKTYQNFCNDERLAPLLSKWANGYLLSSMTVNSSGKVDMSRIDKIADTQFPLCMKYMHRHLRSTHHMKHTGRQQYNLFLKSIGVSLEDALNFWKGEFTKKPETDEKIFNSRYAYNIRHNYGKEGNRKDYSAYACPKIINDMPGERERKKKKRKKRKRGQNLNGIV